MQKVLNTCLLFLSKRVLPIVATALCAIGFLSSSTIAQNIEFGPGDSVVLGTSGAISTATFNRKISGPNEDSRLVRVMWGERSDDPCHVVATMRRDANTTEPDNFVRCHSNSNKLRSRRNNRRTVILDDTNFLVTGVAVCMNSSRNKIKGIRLIAETVECVLNEVETYNVLRSDETPIRQGGMDYILRGGSGTITRTCHSVDARYIRQSRRANCNNRWASTVMCPPSYIVTGLQLATRTGNNGRGIVQGIAPVCRGIVRPSP